MTSQPLDGTQRDLGYDLLRVLAICAVVLIHVFGPTAANEEIAGSVDAWLATVLAIGSIWSVPVFVMLSGALSLNDRAHRDGPGPFYRRRARRILPALVVWTAVYLAIRIFVLNEGMYGWKVVELLVDATVYPHLYFLWLIAGLYIVAPVLHAFLANGGVRRAAITAAASLGLTLVVFMLPGLLALGGIERPIHLGALTFWIAYVGYFVTGYAISRATISSPLVAIAALGALVLGAVTIVQASYPDAFRLLSAVSPVGYLGTIVALLSICVLVAGVALLGRLPFAPRARRLIVHLSEASFGVYLVHLVVLLVPYTILRGFHEHRSAGEAAIAWLFVIVVSFAISLGARRVPVVRAVF